MAYAELGWIDLSPETHTVRSFVELAFAETGIGLDWRGTGVEEHGDCHKTGRALVRVDPAYFRPPEVDLLIGNPAKAREKLGWTHTVGLKALVQDMITHDLAEALGQPIPPSPVLAALAAEGAPHDG